MTGTASTGRSRFPPSRKLRASGDFLHVRKAGRRIGDALFGVHYLANELDHPRLGMAVSVKAVGNAVRRNRVRRAIRESFRLHQHELPPVDVLVTARPGAKEAQKAAVFASLRRLWCRIRVP